MPFHLGVFDLLMSWLNFLSENEAVDQAAEEAAVERYLKTMEEDELQQLLDESQ